MSCNLPHLGVFLGLHAAALLAHRRDCQILPSEGEKMGCQPSAVGCNCWFAGHREDLCAERSAIFDRWSGNLQLHPDVQHDRNDDGAARIAFKSEMIYR